MINNTPTYISLFSSAGVGCYGFKKQIKNFVLYQFFYLTS